MKPLSSAWLTQILSLDPQGARGAAKLVSHTFSQLEIANNKQEEAKMLDLTLPTLEV